MLMNYKKTCIIGWLSGRSGTASRAVISLTVTSEVQLKSACMVSPNKAALRLSYSKFFSLSGLYTLTKLLALLPLTSPW